MKNKKDKNFLVTLKNIVIYILIFFLLMYIGLIIGYSVIGKGKIFNAFDLEALRHIIDKIKN